MPSTASLDTIFICFTDSGRFRATVGLYKEFLTVMSENDSSASFTVGKSQDIALQLVLCPADAPVIRDGGIRNGQVLPYWLFADEKEATDVNEDAEKCGYRDTNMQPADQYLVADGAGDFLFFGGHPNPSFPLDGTAKAAG